LIPTTQQHTHPTHTTQHTQVKRIAKLGAVPSFTAGSILGVGDYLTHLYGADRDLWVMPAASFTKAGVNWTINTDHPSGAGQNLLLSLQDISNRATAKGRVLGPLEKVPRYDALRAMTINNAQLIGEDRTKGSLEPGKLADLVILGRNPIKGDASTVKDIPVLETIKEGRVVYKRPADAPAPPGGFTPGNEAQEADEAVHPAPPAGAPLPRVTPAQVATVTSLLGA
jgi:predicted amidohydrolase YtcJ